MSKRIIERVYFTDEEVLRIMGGMTGAIGSYAGNGGSVFFPVGGGGKRDFVYFRTFLDDYTDNVNPDGIDYALRNLVFGVATADGHKRVYMMTDENNERVHVRDVNPYKGKKTAIAVPFESTLKGSASSMVGALCYIGKRARRHGFERIYVAAIRDHLGIANVAGITQYGEFIGAKKFMESQYPAAFEKLGQAGALDLLSDDVPEEIDIDRTKTVKHGAIVTALSAQLERVFSRTEPDDTQKASDLIKRTLRTRGV